MRDEFYAFHVECATGYKIIADIFEENEKCRLREITYTTLMADPWIPIRKNSSYKEITKIAYVYMLISSIFHTSLPTKLAYRTPSP